MDHNTDADVIRLGATMLNLRLLFYAKKMSSKAMAPAQRPCVSGPFRNKASARDVTPPPSTARDTDINYSRHL